MTLKLCNVTIGLPDRLPFCSNLNLTVLSGQVVTIMGASGIGKSTLLDFVGGHLAPRFVTRGEVWLNGQDVAKLPAEAREIGIMFQEAGLFPHLCVGDNLAFGLRRTIKGATPRRAAIDAALDQAGLAGFYNRDPATLSGGQRARAALMRTLLAAPKALLLDEPFSKLDAGLRAEIRRFVFEHAKAQALPVLLVTHDAEDAVAAGGPVLTL